MNLTKAETWDTNHFDDWDERYQVRISVIRQIQADALRFAAYECNERYLETGSFIAEFFTDLANQLHPIKEQSKDS